MSRLNDEDLNAGVGSEVEGVVHNVDVAPGRKQQLVEATAEDSDLSALKLQMEEGWPEKYEDVDPLLKPFWSIRADDYFEDGLLFYGHKIIVPRARRKDILNWPNLGVEKMRSRARVLFY